MVYLKGIFVLATILMVTIQISAGSTKITYKKPIYGKSNVLKDKRIPQKAAISPKAQDIAKTPAPAPTTTTSTASTTTASPMTTTIVEPNIAIDNNDTIALTTAIYSNGISVPTTTTTTNIPENVDTREEQPIEQVYMNAKDDKDVLNQHNKGTTLPPTTPLSPTIEDEVAAELITLPETDPEMDVLVGANSHAVAVVQSPLNTSSKVVPLANKLPEAAVKSAPVSNKPVPCTCGVFLSSQFKRGSSEQPTGLPVIMNELDRNYACNAIGQKQCQTKCLEIIVQHLPNSANILCATLDRDCRKERAYLFIKNCRNKWVNTNLAAGREYCCKNGQSYSCPLV